MLATASLILAACDSGFSRDDRGGNPPTPYYPPIPVTPPPPPPANPPKSKPSGTDHPSRGTTATGTRPHARVWYEVQPRSDDARDDSRYSAFTDWGNKAKAALRLLPIVYRRPNELAYDTPTVFTLIIASQDINEAREHVAADVPNGTDIEAQVRLSDKVEAKLWSPDKNVEIIVQSDPVRNVTSAANTVWTWSVRPKTTKPVVLALDVTNFVTVNGKEIRLNGPAYRDRFSVKVKITDRVKTTIEAYDPIWKWVVGVVTALGGAFVFVRRLFTKSGG